MEKTPEFLMEKKDAGIDATDMSDLETLITEMDTTEMEVKKAEAVLKAAKERYNAVALDRLPDFLLQHGIKKLGLEDGREVSIKEDISATVKDEAAFRLWLKERKEDDIIKVKYAFARMPNEMLENLSDFLMNNDYDFEIDESIHSQTKKKYFKELLKEMARTDLPEWVNIYDIRKAVIK